MHSVGFRSWIRLVGQGVRHIDQEQIESLVGFMRILKHCS
jgi:hypothetical protein